MMRPSTVKASAVYSVGSLQADPAAVSEKGHYTVPPSLCYFNKRPTNLLQNGKGEKALKGGWKSQEVKLTITISTGIVHCIQLPSNLSCLLAARRPIHSVGSRERKRKKERKKKKAKKPADFLRLP